MMDGSIQSQIVQFNLLFKRYDDIYRRAAKQFDMPELTLWILYALREKPDCTQKDLTDLLLQPKQSIHAALKTLIADGYVVLEHPEHNRLSKFIRLTDAGAALAGDTADRIVQAEQSAFLTLTEGERETILSLFDRLCAAMQEALRHIEHEVHTPGETA